MRAVIGGAKGEIVDSVLKQGLDCVRYGMIFFALAIYNIHWAGVLQGRFGDGVAGRVLASGGALGIALASIVVLASIHGRFTLLRRLFQDSSWLVACLLPVIASALYFAGKQWLTVPVAIVVGGLCSGSMTLAMGRETGSIFLRHPSSSVFPRVRAVGSIGYFLGVAAVPELRSSSFVMAGAVLAGLMLLPRGLPKLRFEKGPAAPSNVPATANLGGLKVLWPILLCAVVFPNCAKTFDTFNALLLVPRPDWLQLFGAMIALEVLLLLIASTSIGTLMRSRWIILVSASLWACSYMCLTSEQTLVLGVLLVAMNCSAQTMMQLRVGDVIRAQGDSSGSAQSALQVSAAIGNASAVLPIYIVTTGDKSVIDASVWYTGVYVSLATIPLLLLCVLRFPQARAPMSAEPAEVSPLNASEQVPSGASS